MKCKELQEKEKINLELQNKKNLQKLKEKGITLIALVVTIIILLILAGVTLNMAMSGNGLFSKARNAADKYKKAQEDEADLISEVGKEMNREYVGAYVTGYTPTSGSCTITGEISGVEAGSKENSEKKPLENIEENGEQIFTTAEETDLKWRIWDYDGTTLRIISDRPTTQKLTLKGAAGYNDGVWAINEICRQCFGQYEEDNDNKKMKEGISVANLRKSDIEKVITYDYATYSHEKNSIDEVVGGNGEIKYGMEIKRTNSEKYPAMWEQNDRNWTFKDGIEEDKEGLIWEKEKVGNEILKDKTMSEENMILKTSYWYHIFKGRESEFKDERYAEMVFGSNTSMHVSRVWLASREVDIESNKANRIIFGMGYSSFPENRERLCCWVWFVLSF